MISLYGSWHGICRESPGTFLLQLYSLSYNKTRLFMAKHANVNRGQAHDAIFDRLHQKMPCFIAYLWDLLYTWTFVLFFTFLGYVLV